MAGQKTSLPKKDQIKRQFYIVDADGKTLGRLATKIALVMQGKHKPSFAPHMDMGDSVIVINAEKIRVTGKKTTDKFYDRYSGFHSGLKSVRFEDMLKDRPTKVLELAINRMLPRSKLGDRMKTRLFIYAGMEHPHKAQQPVAFNF